MKGESNDGREHRQEERANERENGKRLNMKREPIKWYGWLE